MEQKTIDLREVKVTEIDGTENTVDISQRIAQELYVSARELPVVIAAQELYKGGTCTPKPDDYDRVASAIRELISQWGYVLRTAIEKCLDK